MHSLDWIILGAFGFAFVAVALYTRKYSRSVVDFLAANRCAGRYLLTIAEGAAGIGAITVVAQFELFYSAGFAPALWEMLNIPLWLILSLSGWIIYRFRQTRALTMAQFLELRYGRGFRVFAGFMAFVAGVINYGIFPAVTARFFMYVFRWPESFNLGGVEISTFATIMVVLIGSALFMILNGGQVVIIVTDFLQGQFINIVFIVCTVAVLSRFEWHEYSDALVQVREGASKVNPFDTARAEDFNLIYFLIALFGRFYSYMCWQGSQGYNASALSPHEARMARILSQWRATFMILIPMIFAVSAFIFIHGAGHETIGTQIQQELAMIPDAQIQTQMTVPIAVRYLLPAGLLGLFVAMMFAAGVSTDSTYLHSWGSIFLQDVVMPFRRNAFAPKTHILLLKLSIFGVAVFAFLFSLFFKQTEYILLFFMLTGALFAAGAGVCIIGGLYWNRGTKQGAWAAMSTGVLLVLTGFTLDRLIEDFFLSYIHMVFIAQLSAIFVYVTVSLITGRGQRFDLDRMLHRGEYALEEETARDAAPIEQVPAWQRRLGINQDFTSRDRFVYFLTVCLLFTMLGTFFGALLWHFTSAPSHAQWMLFWKNFVTVNVVLFIGVTIWMLIGGTRDLHRMFQLLGSLKRDAEDDGFVVHGQNAGEENRVPAIAHEDFRHREKNS